MIAPARRPGDPRAGRHSRRARRGRRRAGRASGGLRQHRRRRQRIADRRELAFRSVVRRLSVRPHRLRPADSLSRARSFAMRSHGWAGFPIEPPRVAPSPDRDYRMRARLHVRGDRVGFFREGTHDLCDAAATGQLTAASRERGGGMRRAHSRAAACRSPRSSSTENIAADQRVAHVIAAADSNVDRRGAGRGAEGGRPDRRHGSRRERRGANRRRAGRLRSAIGADSGSRGRRARCSGTPNRSSRRIAFCCPHSSAR